ncbi:MAG: DUF418 domain-containing protein [Myxococcota bacterium]
MSKPGRIVAIDTLRGFALLGILLMNIMSFSMPEIAYFNPSAYGFHLWFDQLTYFIVHVIADQKFMSIFSMLFGASVMLIITKMEGKGHSPLRYHYVRNFWLLLLGLLHSLLIWVGDILTIYALSAFLLYPLRRLSPRWQFGVGLALFLSPALTYLWGGLVVPTLDDPAIAELSAMWKPSAAALQATIDLYQGPYQPPAMRPISDGGDGPVGDAVGVYYLAFLHNFFARALGMMLMGMALFTWGVLTAKRSDAFYRWMMGIGLTVGPGLSIVGLALNSRAEWSAVFSPFFGQVLNLLATPLTATGYVALIMLWSRTALWRRLQDALSSVGRMALTNYIGQSVLATFIFHGWGLGLFGSVGRAMQIGFVVAIWAFQLVLSVWWMQRFRYGPLEWLWRSLSLWRLQPMRKVVS